ncbi:MAG TPA: hypothetical protein VGG10_05560 [Rhizomicrobium sp.]|jgi:hypothetical protein
MITGAHIMIQSRDDQADKAFLTDVLKLNSVDAGHGFLIFGLPPAEIAVHKSEHNDLHELYFMCDDIDAFVAEMKKRRITASEPIKRSWGTESDVTLPGGGKIGVYQPDHPRPAQPPSAKETALEVTETAAEKDEKRAKRKARKLKKAKKQKKISKEAAKKGAKADAPAVATVKAAAKPEAEKRAKRKKKRAKLAKRRKRAST